jgi:hypothetical protein
VARKPSSAERQLAERITNDLSLSSSQYRAYRRLVGTYLVASQTSPPYLRSRGLDTPVRSLKLRTSAIFRREYLVAFVDEAWMRRVAPNCDAMAGSFDDVGVPPLVMVPEPRRRDRSAMAISVLEHEFVHINQGIFGRLPGPAGQAASAVLDTFYLRMAAEYEANFLQVVRWPSMVDRKWKSSIWHWALLRGWSQALEETLAELATDDTLPSAALKKFLDLLSSTTTVRFRKVGVAAERAAPWFQVQVAEHVRIAIEIVCHATPTLTRTRTISTASLWAQKALRSKSDTPTDG